MDAIKTPTFVVQYNGKNMTANLKEWGASLTYTDALEDKSDELTITLDDDGRWGESQYPTKGATLMVMIGYEGEDLVKLPEIILNKISINSPPRACTLSGLAATTNAPIRSNRRESYKETTLAGILNAIASRAKLKVVGKIEHIPISHSTQNSETDLQYANRLAKSYGYMMSIKGDQLCFFKYHELGKTNAIAQFRLNEIENYDWSDEIITSEFTVVNESHRPHKKKTVKGKAKGKTGTDAKKMVRRAENEQQALLQAQARAEKTERDRLSFNITVFGNPLLMAGCSVDILDAGVMTGKWLIKKSTHNISDAGYTTALELTKP